MCDAITNMAETDHIFLQEWCYTQKTFTHGGKSLVLMGYLAIVLFMLLLISFIDVH